MHEQNSIDGSAAIGAIGGIGYVALEALDLVDDVYLFVKDRSRRFTYCNTPFLRLMGLEDRRQLYGLRDEELSPPELVKRYRSDDQAILDGARQIESVELIHSGDGTYSWFVTRKFPVESGRRISGVAGVSRVAANATTEFRHELAAAVDLMINHYDRRLDIAELAASVSLSRSQFARRFTRFVGVSPHRFLVEIRINAAADLLASSDETLASIAMRTGFYDQSHMTNSFVRFKGTTPGSYRNHRRRETLTLAVDRGQYLLSS